MNLRNVHPAGASGDRGSGSSRAPAVVGIGEIHSLFQQERAQMFVDLLQGGVFEGFVGAFLRFSLLDFIEGGPVLHELNAGELFEDPRIAGWVRAMPQDTRKLLHQGLCDHCDRPPVR
jgi:hypothetical protein